MPAKKSRKTGSKSTRAQTSKTSEKPVNLETYDRTTEEVKDDNNLLSGLMKLLIVLAVVDFLAILGIIFIILAIKAFRFIF